MFFASILVGLLNPFAQYLWWTVDWWHPETITGTRVGIEDFIVGFAGGGIASVIYEDFYRKRFSKKPNGSKGVSLLLNITGLLVLTAVLFYIFDFSSFISLSLSLLVFGFIINFYRKDLIRDSIYSGLFMTLTILPVYFFMIYISPGWVEVTYDSGLTGIRPLGIPIEELIFYFLFGFYVGPIYEYWKGKKLVKV